MGVGLAERPAEKGMAEKRAAQTSDVPVFLRCKKRTVHTFAPLLKQQVSFLWEVLCGVSSNTSYMELIMNSRNKCL